jgi:hypothetical protein
MNGDCATLGRAFALRGRRQGAAAPSAPPTRNCVPVPARSCHWIDALALRGRRQGAAALPAPTARGFAPGYPNLMWSHNECQTRMPTGRLEQAIYDPALGTTEACADAIIARQGSFAGGSGARCAGYPLGDGEREGRSRLAEVAHYLAQGSATGTLWVLSPLASPNRMHLTPRAYFRAGGGVAAHSSPGAPAAPCGYHPLQSGRDASR